MPPVSLQNVKDKQQDTLIELKKRLSGDLKQIDQEDDTLFLRFLRARDFDIDKAEVMLRNNIDWRNKYDMDNIAERAPPKVVEYFPFSCIGFDKDGSSIRFLNYGNMDGKGIMKSATKEEAFMSVMQIIESDVHLLKDQTKKLGKSIETWSFIFDFDNVTLAQVVHKPLIDLIMMLLSAYEANYPERIKQVVIINASIYFTLFFNAVKPMLAGPTIAKIKVFGKTGYKEYLSKLMELDVLPAFLGGNRTDPDGNPKCHSLINHGGTVPKSYYFRSPERRLSFQPGVKKYFVSRMSKVDIPLNIHEVGSHITWEFETEERDIEFALYFQDESKPTQETLIPKQRIESHLRSQSGVIQCNNIGKYTLLFDNSYSWMSHKDVFCKVEVVPPNGRRIVECL